MLKLFKIVVLVTTVGFVCLPADAFPFGKKDKKEEVVSAGPRVRHEYHLNIPSEKTEQELMGMLKSRKLLEADVSVLLRLEESRMAGFLGLQKKLKKEFNINPKRFYAFDRETSTIYDVTAGEKQRTEHMTFQEDERAKRFVAYSAQKKSAYEEIGILKRLLKEQQVQLGNLNKLLSTKFSLNSHKGYYYDKKSMILYEVIPVWDQD